jgi:hypothetical protein
VLLCPHSSQISWPFRFTSHRIDFHVYQLSRFLEEVNPLASSQDGHFIRLSKAWRGSQYHTHFVQHLKIWKGGNKLSRHLITLCIFALIALQSPVPDRSSQKQQTQSQPVQAAATPSPSPINQQASGKQEESSWKKAGEIVDVVLKIMGSIAAAMWTIFLVLKERKLKSRLEPKVTGKVILGNSTKYVLANVQVKNPGTSKVDIDQEGSALMIYTMPPIPNDDNVVKWEKKAIAISVLKNHHWIEPGETVEESALIPLQNGVTEPIKIRLKLNSQKVTWETTVIIENTSSPAVSLASVKMRR